MAGYGTQAASAPPDADVESDAGSYFGADDDLSAGPSSPLLPNNDLSENIVPSVSFRRLLIAMCLLLFFVIEVSQFILGPPTQQIMEDIVCRRLYPDHTLGMPQIQDGRCKNTDVQKTLAMVRSWSMAGEMFFPLLVQVPFGIVADKYGRRPVLFLSLFGCLLKESWILAVLLFPDTFSIWAILYGNFVYLIGGGGPMASAMVWTILSDAIPIVQRTGVFYQMYALTLLIGVLINPLAALLLSLDPWMAIWIGYTLLFLGVFSALLVPETLKFRHKADSKRREDESPPSSLSGEPELSLGKKRLVNQAWFAIKNDMSHVYHFILGSKSIMLLIFAYGLFSVIKLAFLLDLLQYLTKRFDWDWSTATYVLTVSNLVTTFSLLVVLPFCSTILTNRYHYNTLTRDLLLGRASIIFVVLGSLFTALAPIPWMFIIALTVYSIGNGYGVLCRALINAIVEPHTAATVNTTISTVETLMGLLSAPVMGWLLGHGMELGGGWMGLPYFVTTILAIGSLVAIYMFRLPSGFAQASSS